MNSNGIHVSVIFKEKPLQWGFRGDPYLWNDLSEYFNEKTLPFPTDIFVADIYKFFRTVTGEELGTMKYSYVSQYAHGGMSSGGLSHQWWIDKGIPLLLSRLEWYNSNII